MQLDLFGSNESYPDDELKTCKVCNVSMHRSFFQSTTGGTAKQRTCKACFKSQYKKVKELRATIPLPSKDYCCPICKRNEANLKRLEKTKSTVWSFDHCWDTLSFRGWVCHRCNRGLGFFVNDPVALNNAATYLRKHDERS